MPSFEHTEEELPRKKVKSTDGPKNKKPRGKGSSIKDLFPMTLIPLPEGDEEEQPSSSRKKKAAKEPRKGKGKGKGKKRKSEEMSDSGETQEKDKENTNNPKPLARVSTGDHSKKRKLFPAKDSLSLAPRPSPSGTSCGKSFQLA